MDYAFLFLISCAQARMFCEETKLPLEVGEWRHNLINMDSAVVENKPVTISEGQYYVYDNYFPGYVIKYIHVDNVAIRSCGASATIKSGGVNTSSVLIVLHAPVYQEIRSVVDVWGSKDHKTNTKLKKVPPKEGRSLYLFGNVRAVNHNPGI